MTIGESRRLRNGDRVLVAGYVCNQTCGVITGDEIMVMFGDVDMDQEYPCLFGDIVKDGTCLTFSRDEIIKRIAPHRRFKEGDIVKHGDRVMFVVEDEYDSGYVEVCSNEDADSCRIYDSERLTLICPVEKRNDRKGDEQ